MRPRYKVAYKMVTDMEWRCCHGYSGEDCQDGRGAGGQSSNWRPQPDTVAGRGIPGGSAGGATGSGVTGGNSGE